MSELLNEVGKAEEVEEYERLKALAQKNFREKTYDAALQYYDAAANMTYRHTEAEESLAEDSISAAKLRYLVCKNNAAQCCIHMKNYNDAIIYASQVLALDSKNVKALYRRGMSYLKLNPSKIALAYKDLNMCSVLESDNMQANSGLESVFFTLNSEYLRLEKLATTAANAENCLAAIRYFDEAADLVSCVDTNITYDSIFKNITSESVITRYMQCNTSAAQCCIKIRDFKGVIRYASLVLSHNPKNLVCLYRRGMAYTELQRHKDASNDFFACLELEYSAGGKPNKNDIENLAVTSIRNECVRLKALAADKYKEDKYEEAINFYNEACEVIYYRDKFTDSSELSTKISMNKEQKALFYAVCKSNVAQCFIKQRNFESSIETTSMALAKDPRNVKALYRRGISYLKLNEIVKAIDDFELILSLEPENKEVEGQVRRARAMINQLPEFERLKALGTDNFKEKKWVDAIQCFNEAAFVIFPEEETDPIKLSHYVICKSNAAQCSMNMKDFDQAVSLASQALEKDSKNVKALYRRGKSYLALNNGSHALMDFKNGLSLDPEDKQSVWDAEVRRAVGMLPKYKNEANKALYAAVEEGSLEKINEAWRNGADVSYLSEKKLPGWIQHYTFGGRATGNSALHLACWLGLDIAIINRLLELGGPRIHLLKSKCVCDHSKNEKYVYGFDVNIWEGDTILCPVDGIRLTEYTPLHCASFSGNKELVKLLLEQGCHLDERDDCGSTALTWAAREGHKEIVELLLSHGANIRNKEKDGMTPLLFASSLYRTEVVELLLSRGLTKVDVEDMDGEGCTSLMYSAFSGFDKNPSPICREVAELLLNHGANIHVKSTHGKMTALNLASTYGRLEVVELLLSRGGNANDENDSGSSCLYGASSRGHKDVVNLLLDHGADASKRNNDKITPLMAAVREGYKEVVEVLIERGVDVRGKDKTGNTCLLIASDNGHKEVVELLLDRGANISERNRDGDSCLTLASSQGHKEVVELLLFRGADITVQDNKGETSLEKASDALSNEDIEDGKIKPYSDIVDLLKTFPILMSMAVFKELRIFNLIDMSTFECLHEYFCR